MPENTEPSAKLFVPADATSIDALRNAATGCQGCHLYQNATQTVFGAGPPGAKVVMVGEQPGDVEDRKGAPFVGPAGAILDRAIEDAGLDRRDIYVTNAVKHFKFARSERGKRRIHQTPDTTEITACRPWLVAEFALLRPDVIVALGATAAKALLGPSFRVTRSRGVLLPWPQSSAYADDFPKSAGHIVATFHPSAVLRADDRDTAYADLLADLTVVASALP